MSAPAGADPGVPVTPEQRAASGKAARRRIPLDDHARCDGAQAGSVELLREQDHGRVPELVPIRYGRMLASPFAFFRGSAVVMAEDLSGLPDSGLQAQLCGDAHLANFGVYASPERRLVFDVNDFDETLRGPFEWDVKRLVASVCLAGRANGLKAGQRAKALRACAATYRTAMRQFAGMGNLAVWYASLDVDRAMADLRPRMTGKDRRRTDAALRRARTRDHVAAVRKLTETTSGRIRFRHDPPLVVPLDRLLPDADATTMRQSLLEILAGYRSTLSEDCRHLLDQFRLVDVARKVVGVGSVGTPAWVLLLTGRDGSDPLVLQAKEAGASVLEGRCAESPYAHAGQRVVTGQRLVQAASDIFLGWERTEATGVEVRDYYVRQLWDGKASADVATMSPRRLTVYGELCAWTLARAHARSGDRFAIAAYLGKRDTFERALAEFAEACADRTEDQYRQLREAVDRGTVVATPGV